MDTNYRRRVKKALMGILQYSLDHRTNTPELYRRVNESLQKHAKNSIGSYSRKQIDDLAKKLLLSDSALIEKLRQRYNDIGDIRNISYGTVYRLLKKIYLKIEDFEWSPDAHSEKLFVPKEPLGGNGKVLNGCKCGRVSHGHINLKPLDII